MANDGEKQLHTELPYFQGVECRAAAIHCLKMEILTMCNPPIDGVSTFTGNALIDYGPVRERLMAECNGLITAIECLKERIQ